MRIRFLDKAKRSGDFLSAEAKKEKEDCGLLLIAYDKSSTQICLFGDTDSMVEVIKIMLRADKNFANIMKRVYDNTKTAELFKINESFCIN